MKGVWMRLRYGVQSRIRGDVLSLTLPVVTEQVFVMLMGVVNTIMAGYIGKEAVSAIGMVDSMNFIFISFFSAAAVGATVVVAHYAGQRNIQDANRAVRQALFSGLSLALGVTIAIAIIRRPITGLLFGSAEPLVMDYVRTYLAITLFTYPAIAVTAVVGGVLRGAGDTRTPMKVTLMMNITNALFSYLLIYGLRLQTPWFAVHFQGLGIVGAALGIASARTMGAAVMILILVRGSKEIRLTGLRRFRPDWALQRSIFNVGIPASLESLMFNTGKLITQIFIVGMGTASIASNFIASSVFSMINVPGSALSIVAITLVGQHMGRGETEEARDTMLYLVKFTAVCLLILCGLAFPFAGFLVSLYSREPEILRLSTLLIQLSAFAMPFLWGVSFVLPSGLRGAGDAKYTMITAVIGMWAFRVTFGYVLGVPMGLGVPGIWLGMYTDWLVRGILYYRRVKQDRWTRHAVIKTQPNGAGLSS